MHGGKQPGMALEPRAEMQRKGLGPSVITHSAAISACEKGKQPDMALEPRAEMQRKGLEPSVINQNPILHPP